jgi:hypothetical protein
MSKHGRNAMRVLTPIDNRERDIRLTDRETVARLAPPTLEDRLARARALQPGPKETCRDCWYRGRNAVVGHVAPALENPEEFEQRMDEARLAAPLKGRHWIDCFNRGRDAALAELEDA